MSEKLFKRVLWTWDAVRRGVRRFSAHQAMTVSPSANVRSAIPGPQLMRTITAVRLLNLAESAQLQRRLINPVGDILIVKHEGPTTEIPMGSSAF
jgi:hypothetical protein